MTPAAFALTLLIAANPAEEFRQANEAARAGDAPRALAAYAGLAASGSETASLYWNWSHVARSRGQTGEALWALLRARELDPGDGAVNREINRLREAANLDPAEINPEPLQTLGRWSRRLHLPLFAVLLALASVITHATARLSPRGSGRPLLTASLLALACLIASLPVAASFARPTAVVIHRGAPLLDAASPTADPVGTLREGEVVPILEDADRFVRLEDSSGARGWVASDEVRRLTSLDNERRAGHGG